MTNFLSEYVSSENKAINDLAKKATEYQALYNDNKMSKEEYVELLNDLKSMNIITENAEALKQKEALNSALDNLIKIASLI